MNTKTLLTDWFEWNCRGMIIFEGIVPVVSGEERRDAGRVVAINQADTGDWVRYLEENTLYELHTWGYINFHCSDCKNIHFYCFAGDTYIVNGHLG